MLAAFLLIPQLLGAREVACPRHGANHPPAAAAMEPTAGHEHHHESPAQNPAPREHHAPSDCCPAMSSCSSVAAIQVADDDLTSWFLLNEAPLDVVTLALSRVESPDPPPPKV
jgi:hypothetical protein